MAYQILQDLDTFFQTKDTWTQGAFARAWTNQPVPAIHPYAIKWCLTGAVAKVRPTTTKAYIEASKYLVESAHALYGTSSLIRLNDEFGYEAVKNVIAGAMQSYRHDHPGVP